MNPWDMVRTAFGAIVGNKMRAALTMLGIIIGVAAVVSLSSVGKGVEKEIDDTIQGLGSNLLVIMASTPEDASEHARLVQSDVDLLSDSFVVPAIKMVAPAMQGTVRASRDAESAQLQVTATTADYATVRNLDMAAGGFLTDSDVQDYARVVVLGWDAYEELFPDSSYPVFQKVILNGTKYEVVGVVEPSEGVMSEDSYVFVPITTAQQRLLPSRTLAGEPVISSIYASAIDDEHALTAVAESENALREAHGIGTGDEDDFRVISQQEILDVSSQMTGLLTTFLSVIAGISLLVGGIGIMNIMLVTVTERTREIGIRKAVGATPFVVMIQFLIEALVLTLSGGALGIALGIGGSKLMAQLMAVAPQVTPDILALAVGVSTLVGLVFGVYPALRAARLSPIQALRHE